MTRRRNGQTNCVADDLGMSGAEELETHCHGTSKTVGYGDGRWSHNDGLIESAGKGRQKSQTRVSSRQGLHQDHWNALEQH